MEGRNTEKRTPETYCLFTVTKLEIIRVRSLGPCHLVRHAPISVGELLNAL